MLRGLRVSFPPGATRFRYARTRNITRLCEEQSSSNCICHIIKAQFGLIVSQTHHSIQLAAVSLSTLIYHGATTPSVSDLTAERQDGRRESAVQPVRERTSILKIQAAMVHDSLRVTGLPDLFGFRRRLYEFFLDATLTHLFSLNSTAALPSAHTEMIYGTPALSGTF